MSHAVLGEQGGNNSISTHRRLSICSSCSCSNLSAIRSACGRVIVAEFVFVGCVTVSWRMRGGAVASRSGCCVLWVVLLGQRVRCVIIILGSVVVVVATGLCCCRGAARASTTKKTVVQNASALPDDPSSNAKSKKHQQVTKPSSNTRWFQDHEVAP